MACGILVPTRDQTWHPAMEMGSLSHRHQESLSITFTLREGWCPRQGEAADRLTHDAEWPGEKARVKMLPLSLI